VEAYESTVIDEKPKAVAPPPRPKKNKTVNWLLGTVLALGIVATILGVKTCENKDGETEKPVEKKSFTVNGVSFNMVKVDGGTFTMGATEEQLEGLTQEEIGYFDESKPPHSVTLDGYMIGETEVTQALWQAVMGNNPSEFKGDDQRPVENVSWDDCQEFIEKLNTATGQRFRLPTEAEWEFAARGGTNSKGYKYSGSNNIGDVGWYWQNSGDRFLSGTDSDWDLVKIEQNNSKTHPVGTKQPNELGIYDMSGNVWECCNDWYGDYSSGSQTNPQGPSSGSFRVGRGGSWDNVGCRVSLRFNGTPDNGDNSLGLRLAL